MSLNGAAEQDEYTAKKQRIINHKIDITEKLSSFERKSNNPFERMIKFLKEANQAKKIALHGNLAEQKDFLKKIGSNFHIAEKILSFNLENAWKIAGKWNARMRNSELNWAKNSECENWRCAYEKIRKDFQGGG